MLSVRKGEERVFRRIAFVTDSGVVPMRASGSCGGSVFGSGAVRLGSTKRSGIVLDGSSGAGPTPSTTWTRSSTGPGKSRVGHYVEGTAARIDTKLALAIVVCWAGQRPLGWIVQRGWGIRHARRPARAAA